MKHPCIPTTLTPESLAKWITDNSVETIVHIEKTDLSEEARLELQEKSSLASRAMDRLEDIKKAFNDYIKEGTPGVDDDGVPNEPVTITIPPTKGMKALKANRHFADQQIENGYTEESINIYMIPYPEESKMVGIDIEGCEWPEKTREMSTEEINKHKPMLKKEKIKKDSSFLEESTSDLELDL